MKNLSLDPGLYLQPEEKERRPFERKMKGNREIMQYPADRNFRVWYNDVPAGFSLHCHDALEIIFCLKNTYTVTVGNKTYHLKEGDILFIPPEMLHEVIAPSEGVRFFLLFDMKFLKHLQHREAIDRFLSAPVLYDLCTRRNTYVAAHDSIVNIIHLYFSTEEMAECAAYSEIFNLLCIVCNPRQPHISDDESAQHSGGYDKFITILDYIDNNYGEKLTLEDVAKEAGFSKFHFSRLFKQYANTTFYDYLSKKRISVAIDLLMKNTSVTDIAYQTGFNDSASFCRCFKKLTGVSPTQYKTLGLIAHQSWD